MWNIYGALLEFLGYEQEPNSIYEIRICVLQLLFILYLGRILLLLNHGFEFHFACLKCTKSAFPPTIILIESIESFLGFHNWLHFDLLRLEYLHAYSFDEQFNFFVFHGWPTFHIVIVWVHTLLLSIFKIWLQSIRIQSRDCRDFRVFINWGPEIGLRITSTGSW